MAPSPRETSPFEPEETQAEEGFGMDQPNDADLAEMFGGSMPVREEDVIPEGDGELPDLEALRKRIPEKTQVLMEELFRAKLSRVQRVNPKKIR